MKLELSSELMGFQTMPEIVELDCLMPNGCLISLNCSREQTLADIKSKVWHEAKLLSKRIPSIMKLKPPENYAFMSVSQEAKDVEFFDYSKRLCDLNLAFMFFKLVEIEGDMEEKAFNSDLAKATGLYVNELDGESSLKGNGEISDFRLELFFLLRDHLVKSCEKSQQLDILTDILNCSYSPNLELDASLLDPTGLLTNNVHKISLGSDSNKLDINIHVLEVGQSEYLTYNLKNIPFQLTPIDLVSIIIRTKLEQQGSMNAHDTNESVEKFKHLYVLNVCGCDEIFFGDKHTIGSYKVCFWTLKFFK
jgi:phosphatidylinositol-4,5-bisphosphate 3-kinase